jgi:asparagine synthetase B (glutamine-hydrolysing)
MLSKTQEETYAAGLRPPGSTRWFATLCDAPPENAPGFDCRLIAGNPRSRSLYLGGEIGYARPDCATSSGCSVIFDGALYNRGDLQLRLGELSAVEGSSEAALILAGYLRWGEDLLRRLRGTFALIIWDGLREILLCARDPLGAYPLFHADAGRALLVSTSIDILIRQPHISGAVNRAALADYLQDRFPKLEETFFASVSRVPPGHVLRLAPDGRRSYRYWDPGPDGTVNWIGADQLQRFDELLDQAVGRCLSFGPAGIFLSGGLDSVSVAAVAAERSRTHDMPQPWALSLVFPDWDVNEENVQRSVAAHLGLPQVVELFDQAVGSNGLLAPAVEMSRSLSAPLMNTWLPAYRALAMEGKRRGCRVILTGAGGDEWLTITPFLAADLLRAFDLSSLYQLWRSLRRSYRRSGSALLRSLLWRFGVRPMLVPPIRRFVSEVAPGALKLRRRMLPGLSKCLAPEAALRRELDGRLEEYYAKSPRTESFYTREMRIALEHPLVSWEAEELFETGQDIGMRFLQPFWDADLVDLLYRTPPLLLNQGGRSKGLVRNSIARRFPGLGFEQQKKVEATRFYSSVILQEGGQVWRTMGQATALADLGIVDKEQLGPVVQQILASRPGEAYRVWTVLNAETWVRAHI